MDSNGDHKWKEVVESKYGEFDGAMFVYDITNRATFDHIPEYVRKVKEKCKKDIPFMIIGNKMDKSEEREVSYEEGEK